VPLYLRTSRRYRNVLLLLLLVVVVVIWNWYRCSSCQNKKATDNDLGCLYVCLLSSYVVHIVTAADASKLTAQRSSDTVNEGLLCYEWTLSRLSYKVWASAVLWIFTLLHLFYCSRKDGPGASLFLAKSCLFTFCGIIL